MHLKSPGWLTQIARQLQPLLIADKAPLGFVALAGFVAWGVTHIVDRVVESPTLEYKCSVKEAAVGKRHVTCLVRNLSRDKVFTGLHLIVRLPEGSAGTLTDPKIEWLGPTHPGSQGRPPEAYGSSAEYLIPALLPDASAGLHASLSAVSRVEFRMWAEGNGAVRCVNSNWATWVVRNEIAIMLTLLVLAVLAIPVYLLLVVLATRNAGTQVESFE